MAVLKNLPPALLLIFSLSAYAQRTQIGGTVIDKKTKEPLPFVNITVVGTTYGTVSNQDGVFSLNIVEYAETDSIDFRYLGYKTITKVISDLKDVSLVKMRVESIELQSVTIFANLPEPQEIVEKALEMKEVNYPHLTQKSQVFNRMNNSNRIRKFDLTLVKSSMPEIDDKLIKELIDSMPRYSRNFSDGLYNIYSATDKTDKTKYNYKHVGIKKVVLNEDDGGELERLEEIFTNAIESRSGEKRFWKIKSGIFSGSMDESDSTGTNSEASHETNDTSNHYDYSAPPTIDKDWDWDFFQKKYKYEYENKGIAIIDGEQAFVIAFEPGMMADYKGIIYISVDTYAVLRVEFSYAKGKHGKDISLMGINYAELADDGLLIYKKDEFGYFLKYYMSKNSQLMGVNRPVEIIQKKKRTLVNKKLEEIEFKLNLIIYNETCREVLVVKREIISDSQYNAAKDHEVQPEKITSYSDNIWKGYSILEPTKEMKEYKAKLKEE